MNRETFEELIRQETKSFDESLQLIRIPLTATYHTALKPEQTPDVYGLLASAEHAYRLLEAGDAASVERASRIFARVVPVQDRDSESETYGIWPYFYEESLDQMDRPDWNMADFHGKRLIVTLIKHEDKLPEGLAAQMHEAVAHACRAIMKRNVGPHYTNIAIMGAFVTLVGGELLGNDEFRAYGLARLKRFYDFTFGIGTFSEYNSPCYTPIAIRELHCISAYAANVEAVAYADELMHLAWRMAGEHYHAGTGAWSGPHSRTYGTMLSREERAFLEEALADERFEFGENIRCPAELRPLFASGETRYFTEPTLNESDAGYQVHATFYQNDTLSLGTFSKGVMWNQRRNLVAYLKDGTETAYVQLQFLKDGADFCSAMFTGAQARSHAVFGFNLLTDNGAWHSDLDIINGRFRGSDLRIRFKVGWAAAVREPVIDECGERAVRESVIGECEKRAVREPVIDECEKRAVREPVIAAHEKRAELQIGDYKLAVKLLVERCDYGELRLMAGRDEKPWTSDAHQAGESDNGALFVDYVIYSGDEREFDFHQLKEAAWLFQLGFLEADRELPAASVEEKEQADQIKAALEIDGEAISVELSAAPGETHALYASNKAQFPKDRIRNLS